MNTSLHGKSLLAGTPVETASRSFQAINPATNEALPTVFHECTLEAVDAALVQAEEAFLTFRKTTPEARAAFLERIADEILQLGDALIERAHLETGLPKERLTSERMRTANQLRLFAEVVREGSWVDARIDTALPDRKPLPKPDLRRVLVPLGPVIVFGASNFPLAFSVAGGDTASAFAAGNPVIVKAHRAHPGTSELVAGAIVRAAEACALPAGVFSLLHGSGEEIGIALVRHPLARAAGFTGSRVAGRALFDAAAARPEPIPVFAEMSSLNPLFLLPGAMREKAAALAEGLKASVTMGVGQLCTKPGLVFGIGGPEMQAFAEALAKSMQGAAPGTMLHAGIHESYQKGLASMAGVSGVRRLAVAEGAAGATQGEPAVYATDAASFLQQRALHEEVFGPYTLLVEARDSAELLEIARHLEGQLTATVHGTDEDIAAATELLEILERKAGRLLINGFPTGVEVCPSMNHGGPYPATTDVRFTSVGTAAIQRWARPVCYQNFPQTALPLELRDLNPCGLMRLVDGQLSRDAVPE